jgi:membrane associated rhomboid family serine protease
MPNNLSAQVLVSVVFVLVAVVFLNPLHIWMPDMLHMLILGLLVAVFGVVATMLVREQGGDEREAAHRMLAGRVAFLTGAAILLAGIVWQAFTSHVDAWLIFALAGMVTAKMLARIYGEQKL